MAELSPIDQLFDGFQEEATGVEQEQAMIDQRARNSEVDRERLDDITTNAFSSSVARGIHNTVDAVTPDSMWSQQELEQRKADLDYNNASIEAQKQLNPVDATGDELVGDMVPYLVASPAYKALSGAGIIGAEGVAALAGGNTAVRGAAKMAGQYLGTAPVTMGVGMTAGGMTPEQAFETTMFDAAASPMALLSKGFRGASRQRQPRQPESQPQSQKQIGYEEPRSAPPTTTQPTPNKPGPKSGEVEPYAGTPDIESSVVPGS